MAADTARSRSRQIAYSAGYRAALEEIADLAVSDKTRDAALLHIEEWLENAGITREWIGA